jgi:hypothetical protein
MRKRTWKSVRPGNLGEAFELCVEYAAEHRRPVKVLSDLMGIPSTTLYRWLADSAMPSNRIRQFESFCGVSFVSEYLCLAKGDKVVVAIPAGKRAGVAELAEVQGTIAEAMALLVRFYQRGEGMDETVSSLTTTLSQLAYQRSNVQKSGAPELELFEAGE